MSNKKRPTLPEMIDKYVPVHTRAEVREMVMAHGEVVLRLMNTIHDQHSQIDHLYGQIDAMIREEESRHRDLFPMFTAEADAIIDIQDLTRTFSCTWGIPPYRQSVRVRDVGFRPDTMPILFEHVTGRMAETASEQVKEAVQHAMYRVFNDATRN